MEILGEVGGSQRPRNLSKCMKLDCNFQRGWGNNPFRGEVWRIFGTIQFIPDDCSVLAKFDNERFFKRLQVFIIKCQNIIHYFTV